MGYRISDPEVANALFIQEERDRIDKELDSQDIKYVTGIIERVYLPTGKAWRTRLGEGVKILRRLPNGFHHYPIN